MRKIFFSKIDFVTQRELFKRGIRCAFLGFFPLILAAIFCPVSFLEKWGAVIFALGVSLLAYGMVPYQKMCYLKIHPHCLILERETFCFTDAKKGTFIFSYHEIERISFLQKQGIHILKFYIKKKCHPFTISYFSRDCFEELQAYFNASVDGSED